MKNEKKNKISDPNEGEKNVNSTRVNLKCNGLFFCSSCIHVHVGTYSLFISPLVYIYLFHLSNDNWEPRLPFQTFACTLSFF